MVNHKPFSPASDSVGRRLTQQPNSSASVSKWIESRHANAMMQRRATWCSVAAWAFLSGSALVSSIVALEMSRQVRGIFDDPTEEYYWSLVTVSWTPLVLVFVAVLLVFGGIAAFASGRMPGYRSTRSAIHWSVACEAMSRLLSVGITYPDAFRATSEITPAGETKHWLTDAADRVESGESVVGSGFESMSTSASGDVAMLELLITASDDRPEGQWAIASHHFDELARRRLSLLTQMLPVMTTLLSGLLLWISISSTLGWMWKSVGKIVNNDFGY